MRVCLWERGGGAMTRGASPVVVDAVKVQLDPAEPSPVPTAITVFGGEQVPFPKPPRELAERYFHVTAWAEHDRGGHFPAVAEPELLAETLRDVFRPVRALPR